MLRCGSTKQPRLKMTWRGKEKGGEEEEGKTSRFKETKLGRMKIILHFCANTIILVLLEIFHVTFAGLFLFSHQWLNIN